MHPVVVLLGCGLLGGCTVADGFAVSRAEQNLPGLVADDLRLCAGLPDRKATGSDGREYWSYERSAPSGTGSISFAGVGLNIEGGHDCRATFELQEGRVTRMAFSRITSPSACAPLVRACNAMMEGGRVAVTVPAAEGASP
ncbi:hypothetical protein [Roseococcus sp. YIM B11640]|uniref:hypothetical protein n=1 Tax=Roseococcus sp. YIM B11640 TaxID=3133973 RepID=UPI003C7A194D